MAAMIMAWDRLLLDARPDVVIAEYAPMLQLAARGRVPTIAFGTGFSLPPARMSQLSQACSVNPAVVPEPLLLATLNDSLARTGRAPLGCAARSVRRGPQPGCNPSRNSTPTANGGVSRLRRRRSAAGPAATGQGRGSVRLFQRAASRPNVFWQALVNSGLKVSSSRPVARPKSNFATLEKAGIAIAEARSRSPRSWRDRVSAVAWRAWFVSSGLLAGLPQVIIPFDGEKRLTGEAASAASKACLLATFDKMERGAFAGFLRLAWADSSLQSEAQAVAPRFRARMVRTVETEAADMVEGLL